MIVLTPAERRAGLLLVLLLALGAVSDLLGGRGAARGPRHAAPDDSSTVAAREARELTPTPAASGAAATDGALDLNRATARQLDDLPGVGPVLAARILEHRHRFGSFRAIEDLRAVRGIGPRLFERLKSRVRVAPETLDASSDGTGAGDLRSVMPAPTARPAPAPGP